MLEYYTAFFLIDGKLIEVLYLRKPQHYALTTIAAYQVRQRIAQETHKCNIYIKSGIISNDKNKVSSTKR